MNPVTNNQSLNDQLLKAIRRGQVGMVRDLLNQRADLNRLDKQGRNALCVAAKNGHEKAVVALLKAGANIEAAIDIGIDSTGGNNLGLKVSSDKYNDWTALDIANHKNYKEIIAILSKYST